MTIEILLEAPVSLWDVLQRASQIREDIFRDPKRWYLSDCSHDKLTFKSVSDKG